MTHVERLQQIILELYGLDSEHVETVPITETFEGETIWHGIVDVFRLHGHPQAQHAYAWSYKDKDETIKHAAVLGVPPIDSPQKAVQAAVMADGKKQHGL